MDDHIITLKEFIRPKIVCSRCKARDVSISYDNDGYAKIITCKKCGHKELDIDSLRCIF